MNADGIELNQEYALSKIRDKVKNGQKIKVAFYLAFSSTFASEPLYQLMLDDPLFEPTIVIIPVVNRGEEYLYSNLEATYKDISKKYKKVVNSYSKSQKKFVYLADKFDFICTTNPYDELTHTYYSVATAVKENVLSFYIPYGPYVSNIYLYALGSRMFTAFWKIFFEQEHTIEDYSKYSPTKGKNALLFGSAKLDNLAKVPVVKRERKRIILAPHHSVQEYEKHKLSLSTFPKYHTFFIELALKYPDIDFIFRPHPLLLITLVNEGIWIQAEVDIYLQKIESLPNMTYQSGGDYYDTFINSDALIHDCGSFTLEYLFTGKPLCYMMNGEDTLKCMNRFSTKCITMHYQAHEKEDILNFIDEVVLAGKDVMKEERVQFFEENLKYHYPHVSEKILEYIKSEIVHA